MRGERSHKCIDIRIDSHVARPNSRTRAHKHEHAHVYVHARMHLQARKRTNVEAVAGRRKACQKRHAQRMYLLQQLLQQASLPSSAPPQLLAPLPCVVRPLQQPWHCRKTHKNSVDDDKLTSEAVSFAFFCAFSAAALAPEADSFLMECEDASEGGKRGDTRATDERMEEE